MSDYGVVVEDNEDGDLIERPLDVIGTSLAWLDARLQQKGIVVPAGSELAQARARTESYRQGALAGRSFKFPSPEDAFDFVADAVGADFLSKALHLGANCGLTLTDEQWKFLVKGDPILTRAGPDSQWRNWTWELVIASLAASFATNVTFDEPDVLCDFGGKRFAIAAKMAYVEGSVAKAVRKGFKQADGKGDATLVMVNAAGIYPARSTFGVHDFPDGKAGVRLMKPAVDRWALSFGFEGLNRSLLQKSSVPIGVAFFVPMFLKVGGVPAPFLCTQMPVCWDGDNGPDYAFATEFLHACQSVLGFAP
jgi:hypothetical protein